MKIIFMGTPDFAIPSLEILLEAGYEVVAVVTAPDKPAGRGNKLRPSPIKKYALDKGLTVLQPVKLKSEEFLAELDRLQADLAVVVAFRMLPQVVWSKPGKGTFNLHGSLLPQYRGAAPINWAVINGESQTGVSTFFIDRKIDTGEMLYQETIDLPSDWTAGDLHDHMMHVGARLVLKTVQAIEKGEAKPYPQPEVAVMKPAPKIFKENCRINWDQESLQVYNFIRGMAPYPTAWSQLEENSFKIFAVSRADLTETAQPGRLYREGNRLYVSCKDAWLELKEVQLQGKKRMDLASFLNGFKGELKELS